MDITQKEIKREPWLFPFYHSFSNMKSDGCANDVEIACGILLHMTEGWVIMKQVST